MLAVGEHTLGDVGQGVRMATGLGGGIGGSHQDICGALSAGVMVIGAMFGRTTQDEDDQVAYSAAARYRARFLDELGATQCGPLREMAQASGGLGSCSLLVEHAAMILLQVLQAAGPQVP